MKDCVSIASRPRPCSTRFAAATAPPRGGSGSITRGSVRAGTERGAALHDAQLVIAREYGFASWPRWKQFVEARGLDTRGRAAELVRAACAGDMRRASMLLDLEPELERFDLYTACACGTVAPTTRPAGGATSRRRDF
jgi:hypothetical protein